MTLKLIIQNLENRLPELEWQLNKYGIAHVAGLLPRGIFSETMDPSTDFYIAEIKRDLARLSGQKNELAAAHLARRIDNKINLLVRVCCWQNKGKGVENLPVFNLNAISTRQELLVALEANIASLTKQRDALQHRLAMHDSADVQKNLALKAELGEAEKCLTQAKEAYSAAIQ